MDQPAAQRPVPPAVPDHDFGSAVVDLHAHENPLLHDDGYGLALVAHDPLVAGAPTSGVMTGAYNEVDACGTLVVVSSLAGNRGFTLVDVADPAAPRVVSQFPTASSNWDVRLSDDCTTVFVGMELGVVGPAGLPVPMFGLEDAGRGGILVVDVSDPANPVRESYNPVGSTHNVFSMDINGDTYVFNEHVKIMKLVGERGARTLETISEDIIGTHDVHAAYHPITGVPYLFTGTNSLSVWNITDPTTPVLEGELDAPPGMTLWHEQTPAPAMIDGRWLVVGGGESTGGEAQPYSFVNVTDPTAPEFLSDWTLPGAPFESRGWYVFSPHNVAIRDDGRVALANYHAGIWVVDASTKERQEAPVTLGFDFPNELAPGVMPTLPYAPYVWGAAFLDSGELVVADLNSGLYVYALV